MRLIYDTYPHVVTYGPVRVEKARILVAEDPLRLLIYTDQGGVALTHSLLLTSWNPSSRTAVSIDEDLVTILPSRGCGCGSPLKRLSAATLMELETVST